ncbi:MAG: PhnD/SsuA/transferrin family substrate-binding protein [Acidobacteriota bacterium]
MTMLENGRSLSLSFSAPGRRKAAGRGASVGLGLLALLLAASQAIAQDRVTFFGFAPDAEYKQADSKLCSYLQASTHAIVERRLPDSYVDAISGVVDWNRKDGAYLARLTPYAYVAAEMLGADFEILATYQSRATSSRTYHSYFVVNRDKYREAMQISGEVRPNLADLREYLRRSQTPSPAKFVYHDKFSTSSYFLPSLYFRAQRIFAMTSAAENLIAIDIEKLAAKSSSALVEAVAQGNADLAAVWDGTKTKYEKTPDLREKFAGRVYFIQLPEVLPNDLLVASSWMEPALKDRVRSAIRGMKGNAAAQINVGDFAWWDDIADASDAREALAGLRREAAAPPAPVPVRVEESKDPVLQKYVQAARQAVRLSGTEFVLFDPDFHKHVDVIWTLKLVHDGAVDLTSDFRHSGIPAQKFSISFTSPEDLTVRIGALIHGRIHRIRYVWPYEDRIPTVIRDVDFAIPSTSRVKAQKISWIDPGRNEFTEGAIFDVEVRSADFYKFQLKGTSFARTPNGVTLDFEPMSNIAYRVILVRPSLESLWLKMLTGAFVVLLALAAVAAVFALRRKPSPEPAAAPLGGAVSG